MERYLKTTYFINHDHPEVKAFAEKVVEGLDNDLDKARALYIAVRDGWKYNPYKIDLRKEALQASDLIGRDYGYCTEKANMLAATARAVGIPSRLGFAKVKNHIGTSKLEDLLRTDLLVFHGYAELYLNGKWVKATPAFNKELCEMLHVKPLEFDGEEDSVFQQFTPDGSRYMEYIHEYGDFDDLPRDLYISELESHYPHIFEQDRYEGEDYFFITR